MREIFQAINWEWMGPTIGCFVFAAFIVFTLWVTAKAITAMEDAARGELPEEQPRMTWERAQREIDGYRNPSGYVDSRDYYRVMEEYEKAGERE